ncbi:MAG: hypothetical protein V1921_01010 [Candidatus Altiarchaeota archaeon]
MIQETARQQEYYGLVSEEVYAPHHYYSKTVKRDEYSFNIVLSKHNDCSDYFFEPIKQVIDNLGGLGKLENLDLITTIPSHARGRVSPTLSSLGVKLSTYLNVPFENIIERIKTDESKCKPACEKFDAVHNSMKITKKIGGIKKILLLDDVKVTGVTLLEAKKVLRESGVSETICVCLGINVSSDFFGGDNDNG